MNLMNLYDNCHIPRPLACTCLACTCLTTHVSLVHVSLHMSSLYSGIALPASFSDQVSRNRTEIDRIRETCTPRPRSIKDFLHKPDLYKSAGCYMNLYESIRLYTTNATVCDRGVHPFQWFRWDYHIFFIPFRPFLHSTQKRIEIAAFISFIQPY